MLLPKGSNLEISGEKSGLVQPDFSGLMNWHWISLTKAIFRFESFARMRHTFFTVVIAGFLSIILARKGSTVWSISPDAMVFEAIQLMDDKNVGALPVVDNSRLIGIISERDYTRKVILRGLSSKDTPVRDIMTREVLTASPSDSIADCMRVMTEKRVRHLPVLEGTKMIGIVSIGDVMKWVISAQGEDIERYVRGDHLAP